MVDGFAHCISRLEFSLNTEGAFEREGMSNNVVGKRNYHPPVLSVHQLQAPEG